MPRPTASVVLYLCLVFLSGVLVGGFGFRLASGRPSGPPKDPRAMYEQQMRTRLKLTPEQFSKFHAILDTTGERFHAVREKFRPEFDAVYKQQVEAINQILTDQQRQEYAKERAEREEQRKRARRAR